VRLSVDRGGRLGIAPSVDGKFSKSSREIFLAGHNTEGPDLSLLTPGAAGGWDGSVGGCGTDSPNAGKVEFEGLVISWGICRRVPEAIPKSLTGREIFDADQVGSQVTLRHWQPGDRFQPIGMKASCKLQDYFVNAKVPRAERHRRVVAVNASGTVFWVEGMRISERFKLTAGTTRSLHWVWKRL
jgi:tRNA(Ile)-lysidine synthetase-like protein